LPGCRWQNAAVADVTFSPQGPPETVLPEVDPQITLGLSQALSGDDPRRVLAAVTALAPTVSVCWATLGEMVENSAATVPQLVEAYAYFRVGYHRGLDALRANGWRGSGYVRWEHPSNRGFLRCLDGLRRVAGAIGESNEAQRCAEFLHQLDPGSYPATG
jgi:Protein of unknown function (DUF3151)